MRYRGALVAIVVLALHSVAAAQQLGNLLTNPSAESGTGGWKMMYGNTWTVKPITPDDPDPAHETFYFYPGNDAATELHQWVDVRHLGPTIKAGRQVFEFSGSMFSASVKPGQKPDTAEIFVRYRNVNDGTIHYTYPVAHNKPSWRQVSHTRVAPTATTHIQVVLRATRWTGTSNDAYFDGLSLTTYELPEVEFIGWSSCAHLDSGFDNTTAPPWMSVAAGQTTPVVEAEITPADRAENVDFTIAPLGVASWTPLTAITSPQPLDVRGIIAGSTATLGALVAGSVRDSVKVKVYPQQTVHLAVHVITPTPRPGHPAGGCPPPNPNTSAANLISGLNNIWDQAAIQFTIDSFQHVPVDFDLNNDCILEDISTGYTTEESLILATARNSTSHINVYYVHELFGDRNNDGISDIVATTAHGDRVIFIQDRHVGSTELVTAHEIGHILLRPGDVGITSPHRTGPEVDPLMFPSDRTDLCYLNKAEWDASNARADTFTP